MEEVLNQDSVNSYLRNNCVFCENVEYQKKDYDSLCYRHKIKLLWG